MVTANKTTPFPERVRYFICDFTHAKNIDHSSCLTFKDLKQIAKPSRIVLVFTGMNAKVLGKMRTHGVLPAEDKSVMDTAAVVVHTDLDHGAEWVEERLLARATEIRAQWLVFDSFRKAHSEAIIKASCEAFEAVIGSDVGANLWKYATLRTLEQHQVRPFGACLVSPCKLVAVRAFAVPCLCCGALPLCTAHSHAWIRLPYVRRPSAASPPDIMQAGIHQ